MQRAVRYWWLRTCWRVSWTKPNYSLRKWEDFLKNIKILWTKKLEGRASKKTIKLLWKIWSNFRKNSWAATTGQAGRRLTWPRKLKSESFIVKTRYKIWNLVSVHEYVFFNFSYLSRSYNVTDGLHTLAASTKSYCSSTTYVNFYPFYILYTVLLTAVITALVVSP